MQNIKGLDTNGAFARQEVCTDLISWGRSVDCDDFMINTYCMLFVFLCFFLLVFSDSFAIGTTDDMTLPDRFMECSCFNDALVPTQGGLTAEDVSNDIRQCFVSSCANNGYITTTAAGTICSGQTCQNVEDATGVQLVFDTNDQLCEYDGPIPTSTATQTQTETQTETDTVTETGTSTTSSGTMTDTATTTGLPLPLWVGLGTASFLLTIIILIYIWFF
jgi:hypothetical protein